MKKILTIGGATLDTFITFSNPDTVQMTQKNQEKTYFIFESGKKFNITSLSRQIGGGALNSATSFARLGHTVSSYSCLGNDTQADQVREQANKNGVDTQFIQQQEKLPTATSYIIGSSTLDESIFVCRAANSLLDLSNITDEMLAATDALYITSLGELATSQLENLVRRARQTDTFIAINPGSHQLSKGVQALQKSLPYVDLFIVNTTEAKMFMMSLIESDETYLKALESNKTAYCPADASLDEPCLLTYPLPSESMYFSINKYFAEVLKMGPKIVGITNGANGVYLADEKQIYFHPSMEIEPFDTVGAGDAFGSTFTASLLHGQSLEDSLLNGIINSAAVIQQLGAQPGLLNASELEQRRKAAQKRLQTFSF